MDVAVTKLELHSYKIQFLKVVWYLPGELDTVLLCHQVPIYMISGSCRQIFGALRWESKLASLCLMVRLLITFIACV